MTLMLNFLLNLNMHCRFQLLPTEKMFCDFFYRVNNERISKSIATKLILILNFLPKMLLV